MPQRLVAVVPPSLSNMAVAPSLAKILFMGCLFWVVSVAAQEPGSDEPRYVADIELQNSQQLIELLERASELLLDGVAGQEGVPQVSFVLHGPVIKDLLRQNYGGNLQLVNLAASLSALQVVEIKACRTWMGFHNVDEADLQPFVLPVNLARSEIERLRQEKNYLDF